MNSECEHFFCFDCIAEWSKVQNKCPLCFRTFDQLVHDSGQDSFCCFHSLDQLTLDGCRAVGILKKRLLVYVDDKRIVNLSIKNEYCIHKEMTKELLERNKRLADKAAEWIDREIKAIFGCISLKENAEGKNIVIDNSIDDIFILTEHVKELVFRSNNKKELQVELSKIMKREWSIKFIEELENYVISPWNFKAYDELTIYEY